TSASGVPVNCVAKWNGTAWSALGSTAGAPSGSVRALAVFDDGRGRALYAGGDFGALGGTPQNYVARWNGTTWTSLAEGLENRVSAFAAYDDGSGVALHVAGYFGGALDGPVTGNLAKWDGTSWAP